MSIKIHITIRVIQILCIRGIPHNNDNRRQFVIQNHYSTYKRKGNNELAIQALNIIVADLQTQMNNLSSGSGGGNGDPDGIGTM